MKKIILISILILSLSLVSCAEEKMTDEELDSILDELSDEELDEIIEQGELGEKNVIGQASKRFTIIRGASKTRTYRKALSLRQKRGTFEYDTFVKKLGNYGYSTDDSNVIELIASSNAIFKDAMLINPIKYALFVNSVNKKGSDNSRSKALGKSVIKDIVSKYVSGGKHGSNDDISKKLAWWSVHQKILKKNFYGINFANKLINPTKLDESIKSELQLMTKGGLQESLDLMEETSDKFGIDLDLEESDVDNEESDERQDGTPSSGTGGSSLSLSIGDYDKLSLDCIADNGNTKSAPDFKGPGGQVATTTGEEGPMPDFDETGTPKLGDGKEEGTDEDACYGLDPGESAGTESDDGDTEADYSWAEKEPQTKTGDYVYLPDDRWDTEYEEKTASPESYDPDEVSSDDCDSHGLSEDCFAFGSGINFECEINPAVGPVAIPISSESLCGDNNFNAGMLALIQGGGITDPPSNMDEQEQE